MLMLEHFPVLTSSKRTTPKGLLRPESTVLLIRLVDPGDGVVDGVEQIGALLTLFRKLGTLKTDRS